MEGIILKLLDSSELENNTQERDDPVYLISQKCTSSKNSPYLIHVGRTRSHHLS